MAQRGELGEREAAEGRELIFLRREDRDRGESMGKALPPAKAAGEKVEEWKQPQGDAIWCQMCVMTYHNP